MWQPSLAHSDSSSHDEHFHAQVSPLNVYPSRQNMVWEGKRLGCAPMPTGTLSLAGLGDGAVQQVKSPPSENLKRVISSSSGSTKYHEPLLPNAMSSDQLIDDFDALGVPEATFNLVNTVVGVGVLSVPYAFRLSGYFTLIIIAITIAVTWQTGMLLGSSLVLAAQSPEACEVPPKGRDYSFLAFVAFGRWGKVVMTVITSLEIWFALVTFIVMNGVNASILWPEIGTETVIVVASALSGLMAFVPMRLYSYLSAISSVALILAALALVGSATQLSSWANPYDHLGGSALLQLQNTPRSTGIIVFCFAGHPCFPVVHECMRDRRSWGTSVGLTFGIAFLYYGSLGFFGYWVFGQGLEASFTENIAHVEHALLWRNISVLAFLVKIQLTAPVLLNAIVVSLWAPESNAPEWPAPRMAMLLGIVSVTALVCIQCANKVASVASLSGSLFVMTTSVIFPVLVQLRLTCLYGKECQKGCTAQWLIAAVILMFGILNACVGTAMAVSDLLAGDTEP